MTSRFAKLSTLDRIVLIALIAILPTLMVPASASASTENKTFVFEIQKGQKISIPNIPVYTKDQPANGQPMDPAEIQKAKDQVNAAILQAYLESKKSPLAPYADHILTQDNWKLVLAISNAESTLCKRQMYNNCWGVGGAWNLRRYETFADGFTDVSKLVTNKYIPYGADSAEEMVRKYVGNYSKNWVIAVNQILNQLNQLPFVS